MKHRIHLALAIIAALLAAQLVVRGVNDVVADRVRSDLLAVPCPEGAQVVSAASVAGKLFGNGNGMQYTGALLLATAADRETVEAHYKSYFADCVVEPLADSVAFRDRFAPKAADETLPQYVVSLTRDRESGAIPDNFLYQLLDLDFRGH